MQDERDVIQTLKTYKGRHHMKWHHIKARL